MFLSRAEVDWCREHVRRYLRAPFEADRERRWLAERFPGLAELHGDRLWPAVVTPALPPSLQAALEEWATSEATPDQEIADFIGWPVTTVREHR